jgi:hypothetical protein
MVFCKALTILADLREGQVEMPATILLSQLAPQDRHTPPEDTEEGVKEMEELLIQQEEMETAAAARPDQEEEVEDGLRNEDPWDQEAPKVFQARLTRPGIQVLPDLLEATGAQPSTLIDLPRRTVR